MKSWEDAMLSPNEVMALKHQLAEEELYVPPKIDFMINGVCPLRCDGCWGPSWSLKGSISAEEWIQTADVLSYRGLREVVVSGGEPLLRPDIEILIEGLRKLGLRVTLSSICHGILDRPRILSNIAELGVPLDGPTPEIHARSRPAANPRLHNRSFWDSIRALQRIPFFYRDIQITLRTVVDWYNGGGDIPTVLAIPKTLREHRVDMSHMWWKLYQWNRYVGPRQDRTSARLPREIGTDRFLEIVSHAKRIGTNFMRVTGQTAGTAAGHYFLFEPDGEARLETVGTDGLPHAEWLGHISNIRGVLRAFSQTIKQHYSVVGTRGS